MSVLGKVYLGVSLALFVVGVVWASHTLQANTGTEVIELARPRVDVNEPLSREYYEVRIAALIAGWVLAAGILAALAIRAPFRIRRAAMTQRRIRELEREVMELRTLPLRQQEEDEILAAEAHLEGGTKRVMTEKFVRDGLVPQRDDGMGGKGAASRIEPPSRAPGGARSGAGP